MMECGFGVSFAQRCLRTLICRVMAAQGSPLHISPRACEKHLLDAEEATAAVAKSRIRRSGLQKVTRNTLEDLGCTQTWGGNSETSAGVHLCAYTVQRSRSKTE